MEEKVKLSVLVFRCENIENTKKFYEILGFELKEEKHDKGPVHYSTMIGDIVVEFYPKGSKDPNNTRIEFLVSDRDLILEKLLENNLLNQESIDRNYLYDPDGRRIVLIENK